MDSLDLALEVITCSNAGSLQPHTLDVMLPGCGAKQGHQFTLLVTMRETERGRNKNK
jgi:hypothetical protein